MLTNSATGRDWCAIRVNSGSTMAGGFSLTQSETQNVANAESGNRLDGSYQQSLVEDDQTSLTETVSGSMGNWSIGSSDTDIVWTQAAATPLDGDSGSSGGPALSRCPNRPTMPVWFCNCPVREIRP